MWMWSTGINRNIVECKGKIMKDLRQFIRNVLIETLWNVKQLGRGEYLNGSPVLIETLWNVKSGIRYYNVLRSIVLIETLWNVKSNAQEDLRSEE